MDIKEAIAHAKEQKEIFGGTHKEFLNIAIEALEKQIPKKVNEIYKAEHIEDIEAYGENALFGYCPMCDELQCSVWNANTCGDCGQALNWEVEE